MNRMRPLNGFIFLVAALISSLWQGNNILNFNEATYFVPSELLVLACDVVVVGGEEKGL